MKNASRLLYIVSALFTVGFAAETVSFLNAYDETWSAPVWMYLLTYALCFLLPALIAFVVARLLGRRTEKGVKAVDLRHKRIKPRY